MADTFEFDSWISRNNLTPLKSSFESLQINTLPSILSLSEPLIDFILSSHTTVNALNFTQKNDLKSRLLNALKLLEPAQLITSKSPTCTVNGDCNANEFEPINKPPTKSQNGKSAAHTDSTLLLVVTTEENKVLQSLKQKLKSVEQYEQKFTALQTEYELQELEASKMYSKEIAAIEQCINDTFEKLHSALDKQHKLLLNKAKLIEQTELRSQSENNHKGVLSNFSKDIQECFESLQTQKELLTNSIQKYQQLMEKSTKSTVHLLEFDEDLSERQAMIASMGESIDAQFSSAISVWESIIASMKQKFEKEFECDKHWTFIMRDTLKQLIDDEYPVGRINKIGCSNIIDVDWMDNGSLVLYTQSPLMLDVEDTRNNKQLDIKHANDVDGQEEKKQEEEDLEDNDDGTEEEEENEAQSKRKQNECQNMEQLNNLQLLQYKVRYRYVVNRDAEHIVTFKDAKTVQESENERKEDAFFTSEITENVNASNHELWRNTEWREVTFNNSDNQFLSTIPLKIIPYSIPNEDMKVWNELRNRYQFRYISQVMEIEIQICCQFKLKKECMSFWSRYCPIYTVNEENAIQPDSVQRIDNQLNTLSFVLDTENANHAHLQQSNLMNTSLNNSDQSNNNNNINNGSLTFLPDINAAANRNNNNGNNGVSSFMDSIPGLVMDQKEMETYSHLFAQQTGNAVNHRHNNSTNSNSTASTFQFNVSQILASSSPDIPPSAQQQHQHQHQHQQTDDVEEDGEELLFAEEQIGDTLLLQSGMVRAWRYDEEQDKWRGRGKGNLYVYKNTMSDDVRIIFKDVKHDNKVRLLQRINISYQHCSTNYMNEIEWTGSDFSMDPNEPLNSLWKIKFIDEPDKVDTFVSIFNDAVDECLRNID